MRARSSVLVAALLAACGGGSEPSIDPPANLTYRTNPAAYTVGVAIAANTPTSSGGAVSAYSVAPALPAGLSLDPTTGVISGTPTTATAIATYAVTASNSAGAAVVGLVVTVHPALAPPSGLAYSENPATYTVGVAIVANTPSSGGGAVTAYAVTPALPAGLSLDTTTGVVAGTPTAATSIATYTVTASNVAGSTSVGLVVTVQAAAAPPSGLAYSENPATYTENVAIPANVPTSSGGAVTAYSVEPELPAGLSLDTTTGVVSGTPTAATPIATYTVTASNSGGSTAVGLVITVKPTLVPPRELAYARNPATYTVGVAIAPNTPSSSGGAVADYSVSPPLPAGLSLDATTGVVSGIPATATPIATYTVTASNSVGSTSVGLVIKVVGSAWRQATPLPIARADHAVVNLGPRLYVLGGFSGSTLALVERGEWHMSIWAPVAPMQTARREFAAGVVNGKIYVACGMNWSTPDAVTYVTSTEVYDPATNAWSTLAPCPMDPPASTVYGDVHIGGTVANGRLYVLQSGTGAPGGRATMHAYDPGNNTWSARSPPPFDDARYAVAEVDGSLYLLASYPSRPSASPQTVETLLARYDTASDTWVVGPSLSGIAWPSATGFKGQLYAIGGFRSTAGTMTVTSDVNRFDPVTNAWSSLEPVWVARYRGAATVVADGYDNELCFVGGSAPFEWNTVTPLKTAEGMFLW